MELLADLATQTPELNRKQMAMPENEFSRAISMDIRDSGKAFVMPNQPRDENQRTHKASFRQYGSEHARIPILANSEKASQAMLSIRRRAFWEYHASRACLVPAGRASSICRHKRPAKLTG